MKGNNKKANHKGRLFLLKIDYYTITRTREKSLL